MSKWVYSFGAGRRGRHGDDARSARRQGRQPRRDVPASACRCRRASRSRPRSAATTTSTTSAIPRCLRREVAAALRPVEAEAGARLGDPEQPLLRLGPLGRAGLDAGHDGHGAQSRPQRSHGARAWRAAPATPRFAYDSYRRFIQMYGDVVLGVDHYLFEDQLDDIKRAAWLRPRHRARRRRPARSDRGLSGDRRRSSTAAAFPQDVQEQLWGAIGAVFGSWMTPRAVTYRRLHGIAETMGTAVNVQAMVFGNRGERSATGRRLHPRSLDRREALLRRVPGQRPGRGRGRRHPHAAAADPRDEGGDRRQSAGDGRGDAGRSTPSSPRCSIASRRTTATCRTSSSRSRTAGSGSCRPGSGKRTTHAALKIAVDMAEEGLIDRDQAIAGSSPPRSTSCCTRCSIPMRRAR